MVTSLTADERELTDAKAAARGNYLANGEALADVQPGLLEGVEVGEWEWVYGRDGVLTGISPEGRWLADCSLPGRAAAAMLKSVELRGTIACLLAPVHAAQVRRAIELVGAEQGIIVLLPDQAGLGEMLHCEDFSREIRGHRVLFAVGIEGIRGLFERFAGLPVPSLFLKPATTGDAAAQQIIEGAQGVFREVHAAQGRRLDEIGRRGVETGALKRVCVVAPSVFRLWGDAGGVLAELLDGVEVRRFDPDRPTTASHLAMAEAAAGCDGVVSANFGRSDLPAQVVAGDVPWVTWATTPNVPSGQRAGERDWLIVADGAWVEPALKAGWKRSRVVVAGWPAVTMSDAGAGSPVAVIADTRVLPTDIDEETFEFSSHMVLWELIQNELRVNPLLAAGDPERYLDERMARLSIGPEGLNRGMFFEQLIYPAYQQGLVRVLMAAGVKVRAYGKGWARIAEFADVAAGEIRLRDELHAAVDEAGVLVRALPGRFAQAIDAFPRHVVTPGGSVEGFVRDVKTASRRATAKEGLSGEMLLELLRG